MTLSVRQDTKGLTIETQSASLIESWWSKIHFIPSALISGFSKAIAEPIWVITYSGPIYSAHLSTDAITSALTKDCLSERLFNIGTKHFLINYFTSGPIASAITPSN